MTPTQMFITLIMFILTLVGIGVILYFYHKANAEDEDIINNEVLINLDNSVPHILGLVKDIKVGRKNRSLITYIRDGEEYSLITNNYIELKGKLDDRSVILNFPKHSENLKENVKNNLYGGDIISKYIESKEQENSIINSLREARNREDIIRVLKAEGVLSKDFLRHLNEIINESSNLDKHDKKNAVGKS